MSDQDYVYGIFASPESVPTVVSKLHEIGLKTGEICVLGNKTEQFDNIAGKLIDPMAKHFIGFGIGGAVAGLIAGICVSLHIPGINGFQLIVPLMGTLAGGACFPYFMTLLGAFLSSSNPQHWASVFEGEVHAGEVIVMAEPQSSAQRKEAMDILLAFDPVEVIFRKTALGVSATATSTTIADRDQEQPTERKLTAVA
ncbi:MAG: hypothetical protein JST01_22745 [Cyanobacteria bacterium SZAS TMP-1]|nr:hypothetical protein [Cyanobacteria bacterium SZAS TMP-1]